MDKIRRVIEMHEANMKHHSFILALDRLDDIKPLINIAPNLAFWVMSFQDILRLNEMHVKDSYLALIARHHRLEDVGHEQWFLDDIGYKREQQWGIRKLFCQKNVVIRDAAYALVSEAFHLKDDYLRVLFLLILESVARVFFAAMSTLSVKCHADDRLKYFSKSHNDVELDHSFLDDEIEKKLYSKVLSYDIRLEAEALVDRCYAVFSKMFAELECKLQAELVKSEFVLEAVS